MSAQSEPAPRGRPAPAYDGHDGHDGAADLAQWRDHTRVFLQPVAAPSILGLYGFAAATFIVTAYLVGWYGTASSPALIFPFAVFTGGVFQGIASVWSFRARDGLATAVHGIWAAFWLAWGLLQLLTALGVVPALASGAASPPLAYWFFVLSAITFAACFASLAENLALTTVLLPLATGAGLLGVFYIVGGSFWVHLGGYVTMLSSVTAFYAGTAMMLAASYGRTILPVGNLRKEANVPGRRPAYPIEFELGEPGVRHGQ